MDCRTTSVPKAKKGQVPTEGKEVQKQQGKGFLKGLMLGKPEKRYQKPRPKQSSGASTEVSGYFICAGPIRAWDHPTQEKLAALVTKDDNNLDSLSRINPLQLLETLRTVKGSYSQPLLYMNMAVNGKENDATMNTGPPTISSARQHHHSWDLAWHSNQVKAINSKN